MTCRLLPSGANLDMAMLMGARTLGTFQGKGIYHAAKMQFLREFPSINRFVLSKFVHSPSVINLDRWIVYCKLVRKTVECDLLVHFTG